MRETHTTAQPLTASPRSDKEKTMRFVKPAYLIVLVIMAAAMFVMPANTSVSQASSPPKKYLRHYNELGSWDGFHHIDEELDWYLTKVILQNGGLPTDENKDRLLHGR